MRSPPPRPDPERRRAWAKGRRGPLPAAAGTCCPLPVARSRHPHGGRWTMDDGRTSSNTAPRPTLRPCHALLKSSSLPPRALPSLFLLSRLSVPIRRLPQRRQCRRGSMGRSGSAPNLRVANLRWLGSIRVGLVVGAGQHDTRGAGQLRQHAESSQRVWLRVQRPSQSSCVCAWFSPSSAALPTPRVR